MVQKSTPSEMSMHSLPLDVVEQILGKLNPVDRLESALACRTWTRAVSHPTLMRDVWLRVIGSQMQTIVPIIMNSERRYRNLRVCQGNSYNHNPDFWTKIGRHLRRLELVQCRFSPKDLYFILSSCPKLETLRLKGRPFDGWRLRAEQPELETSNAAQRVRESLRNVRDLHLEFYDVDGVIDLLIDLMPNTSRLSIPCVRVESPSSPNLLPCLLRTGQVFTELDLTGVALDDRELQSLLSVNASALDALLLDTGRLTGVAFAAIAGCRKLRHLVLCESSIGDAQLEGIVYNCPLLEVLDLSLCRSLTDSCLATIHSLQRLRELSLAECRQFTSAAFCSLGKFPSLESLSLWEGIDFRNGGLQNAACFEGLRSLHVGPLLDSDSLAKIVEVSEGLEKLSLFCEELTETDLLGLRRLKNLKNLFLHRAVGITDRAFEEGLGSPSLECLTVRDCPLTDIGLASIAAHHGDLKNLSFSDCKKITDAGLAALLQREPFLEELTLWSCDLVRGQWFGDLRTFCPRLRRLEIFYCPISCEAVELFREENSSVEVLPVEYREWNPRRQRFRRVRVAY